MTKPERAYLGWIHEQRCLLWGRKDTQCKGPVEADHIRRLGEKRDHWRVLPLCVAHHRIGPDARHNQKKAWPAQFGKDLEAEIVRYKQEFQERKAA